MMNQVLADTTIALAEHIANYNLTDTRFITSPEIRFIERMGKILGYITLQDTDNNLVMITNDTGHYVSFRWLWEQLRKNS